MLRGALIYGGILVYDFATGNDDEHRTAHAIAASVGIETFVLLWTWAMTPRVTAPAQTAPGEI